MKQIYLVDDDESLLRSLSRALRVSGFEVTAFTSPVAFLETLAEAKHGCVITDLRMPEMSGLELIEAMERAHSRLPVLFLTGRGEIADSVLAMKRGAINFLTKPVQLQDLLAAVAEAFTAAALSEQEDAEAAGLRERFELLTRREKEVCLRVTRGMLNKQAAWELGISIKTVKVHRARVMEKMQANSLADLVRMVDKLQASTATAPA